MTLETQVVAYLRADDDLPALVPGGIYAYSDLGEEGITDAITTPDVWADGEFQPTIIVREGERVPTGQLVDFALKVNDDNQRVTLWFYATSAAEIDVALESAHWLMMGHAFSSAWPAAPAGGSETTQAPELPTGIKVKRESYMVRSLRLAA